MATFPSIGGVPAESGMEITFTADFFEGGDVNGKGLIQFDGEHWKVYNDTYGEDNNSGEFSEFPYIDYLLPAPDNKDLTLSPFLNVEIVSSAVPFSEISKPTTKAGSKAMEAYIKQLEDNNIALERKSKSQDKKYEALEKEIEIKASEAQKKILKEKTAEIGELKSKLELVHSEIEKEAEKKNKAWIKAQSDKQKRILVKSRKGLEEAIIDNNTKDVLNVCYDTKHPMLLMGPPGCGKNTILVDLLSSKEIPKEDIVIISITADMTKDSFLGHYVLEGEKTVWQDGPFASAIKKGKRVILDEINFAHADILGLLNNVTQMRDGELGTITIADNGGEIIKPHKDARIFATANPSIGNAGTKELNQATMSRFITLEVDYLKESEEVELLTKKFPEAPIVTIETLVDKANKARALKKKKDISVDISTRHLEKALLLITKGVNIKFAINNSVISDCQYEEDREKVSEIFNEGF